MCRWTEQIVFASKLTIPGTPVNPSAFTRQHGRDATGSESKGTRPAVAKPLADEASFLNPQSFRLQQKMPLLSSDVGPGRIDTQTADTLSVKELPAPSTFTYFAQQHATLAPTSREKKGYTQDPLVGSPRRSNLASIKSFPGDTLPNAANIQVTSHHLARPPLELFFCQRPPPVATIVSSFQNFGLEQTIYRDAFYSKESDVPDHGRAWAGKEFKIASLTTPFLPVFDLSGLCKVSPNATHFNALDKQQNGDVQLDYRRTCYLRSWEVAIPPPSLFEVRKWHSGEKTLLQAHGIHAHTAILDSNKPKEASHASQIQGPTPKTNMVSSTHKIHLFLLCSKIRSI